MNIFRNVAGQGVYLYAEVISSGLPKTGDAPNITGSYSLDGVDTTGFATANPTEMGGGVYWQPLAQAETDCLDFAYRWSTTTSGIRIQPIIGATDVKLADGVAHAGTPGSSTASLALKLGVLQNPDPGGDALYLRGNRFGLKTDSDDPVGGAAMRLNGPDAGVVIGGQYGALALIAGAGMPALRLQGPYTTPGPVVLLDATAGVSGIDGGPGIQIQVGGSGQPAIALTPGSGGVGVDGTLSPAALDAIQAATGINIRQAINLILAMLPSGKLSGLPGGPAVMKDAGDGTTTRVTTTFDSNSNRTNVVLNPPA